jgi:hypothetical protein
MKRKLNSTQEDSIPTKKLKTIDNPQKIKDLQSDLKSKSEHFDNQVHELRNKISSLQQDKRTSIESYYLDKILNKEIDYIFLKSDKNVDKTKFKVTKLDYIILYTGTFTGGTIDTCQKEILEDHSIDKILLNTADYDDSIDKYVELNDYDKLLEVAAFTKEDEEGSFIDSIMSDAQGKSKKEINTKGYYKYGSVEVQGEFDMSYYFVQKK